MLGRFCRLLGIFGLALPVPLGTVLTPVVDNFCAVTSSCNILEPCAVTCVDNEFSANVCTIVTINKIPSSTIKILFISIFNNLLPYWVHSQEHPLQKMLQLCSICLYLSL